MKKMKKFTNNKNKCKKSKEYNPKSMYKRKSAQIEKLIQSNNTPTKQKKICRHYI